MKTISTKETTNLVPATKLKEHPDFTLYVDMDSAKEILI
jgi:6-phosphogluconolactonase/glucosamine-6-phosphate isomerase/deaminase